MCNTMGLFFTMGEKKPPKKIKLKTRKSVKRRIAIFGQMVQDIKK